VGGMGKILWDYCVKVAEFDVELCFQDIHPISLQRLSGTEE